METVNDYEETICSCGQEDDEPLSHDDGCPVWEEVAEEQRKLES